MSSSKLSCTTAFVSRLANVTRSRRGMQSGRCSGRERRAEMLTGQQPSRVETHIQCVGAFTGLGPGAVRVC